LSFELFFCWGVKLSLCSVFFPLFYPVLWRVLLSNMEHLVLYGLFLLCKSNTPEYCISELCLLWVTLFSGSRRNSWTFEVYLASFRNHRDNPSHLLRMGFISSGISITFSNFIFKNHFQFLVWLLYYIFVDFLNLFLIKIQLKDAIIVVSSRTDCLLPLRDHVF